MRDILILEVISLSLFSSTLLQVDDDDDDDPKKYVF